MEESKDIKLTPEDVKLILDTNYYLQLALKVMNNISLKDDTEQDYMKLWEKVSLEKKHNSIEYKPEVAQLYYNLISTGYDNFGTLFLSRMIKTNPEYLEEAVVMFIEQLDQNAKYIESIESEKTDKA